MDEEVGYRITRQGYAVIWSWMRFQMQEHEMDCAPQGFEMMDDGCPMSHAVALTLVFVIPTMEQAEAAGLFE